MIRLLRFSDLQERRIVASWPQLRNLQRNQGFPPGRMIGVNTRAGTEAEVDDWLESRPIAGPAPRGVAKRKATARKAREATADA